ncbi:MAG: selenium metabolism-associated LysR family transcriptional regulator [Pirellulales bacterium]
MDLRQLQTFATAIECESFTSAARALNISQAGVSKHIAALEEELDVPLFLRSGRLSPPTDAGRRLYEFARKILDLVDQARQDLGQPAAHVKGTLRIAASTVPAQCLLPRLLSGFRARYPEVRESVTVSDSAQAIEAVKSASADVGIVGELPHSASLNAWAIADDELVLVVAPTHPLAAKGTLSVRQLQKEPIIVRELGSGSRNCVERALDGAGLAAADLKVAMEMNSNETIRAAVEQGVAAAFLSRATIERELAEGRLVPVRVAGVRPRRHLYVISDPLRVPHAASRAFLMFARNQDASRS